MSDFDPTADFDDTPWPVDSGDNRRCRICGQLIFSGHANWCDA